MAFPRAIHNKHGWRVVVMQSWSCVSSGVPARVKGLVCISAGAAVVLWTEGCQAIPVKMPLPLPQSITAGTCKLKSGQICSVNVPKLRLYHLLMSFSGYFNSRRCCYIQPHARRGAWFANWQEWSYFNSFSALKAHSTSLLGIVSPHFISVLRSLKQMMLARRIFCSVKFYNLILVSASYLEEEAKINPSTISSDVFIWKLKANANCRGEVTWRYQMITSCFSWVPLSSSEYIRKVHNESKQKQAYASLCASEGL